MDTLKSSHLRFCGHFILVLTVLTYVGVYLKISETNPCHDIKLHDIYCDIKFSHVVAPLIQRCYIYLQSHSQTLGTVHAHERNLLEGLGTRLLNLIHLLKLMLTLGKTLLNSSCQEASDVAEERGSSPSLEVTASASCCCLDSRFSFPMLLGMEVVVSSVSNRSASPLLDSSHGSKPITQDQTIQEHIRTGD